jgi:DnaJ domain
MEERDYYEVLGLNRNADHEMVVQAYWHLAHKCKLAMERDAFAERYLEELNKAFDVLGSPERREAYDREHRPSSEPETKRVSLEVCFWNLPPWQGVLAAASAVALAALAFRAGAQPVLVVFLAAVAALAGLLAFPELWQSRRIWIRRRWRRDLRAADFQRSTAQALAVWREAHPAGETTSLAGLSTSIGFVPRQWRDSDPER